MKVRRLRPLFAAAMLGVVALAIAGTSSARVDVAQQEKFKVALITDVGGLDDRSFNFLANKGLNAGEGEVRRRGQGVPLEDGLRLHPEPHVGGAAVRRRPDDLGRVPDGRGNCAGREALPAEEVRDHRLHRRRSRAQGQAHEHPRPALQGAGGRLPRRLPRRAAGQERPERQRRHRCRRRPEDPAGRSLHRRLLPGLEGGLGRSEARAQLLAGLRRPGEVQGAGAEPHRERRERRLRGRRSVRPRRPLGCQGAERLRHRRRRRPVLPRQPRADERRQEGRRRGREHDLERRDDAERTSARTSTPSSPSRTAESATARSRRGRSPRGGRRSSRSASRSRPARSRSPSRRLRRPARTVSR